MRQLWLLLYLAMVTLGSAAAQTQAAPLKTNGDVWWKHAVIYEVYPRSFQDTNGDGLGDIKGITQRLSYLKSLGIDAIWITPMYPSPQVDFGYDIADYEAIDPQYGSMGDFDNLMKAAKQQGIRVIMDMVMNHTSDQNPWFLESRSSRDQSQAGLVYMARRQGWRPAEQLAVVVRPLGVDARSEDRTVLLPLLLCAAAGPELAQPRGAQGDV